MKIKISSDSTCDLSKEYVAAHNVGIMPLVVVKDGESFKDGVDIVPEDIFAHVNGGGALCSTSAANVNDYMELFEEYKKEYDAVIHINIGSGFSSSHQNARLAAEDFENVYVVDSMNLSTGHGLVVVEAVKMAEAGMEPDKIYEALNGEIDCFVAGVGSGGTLSGTGEFLKQKNENIKVIAVEPEKSPVLSKGESGAHGIQGIGAGFIPQNLNMNIYDEVVAVSI